MRVYHYTTKEGAKGIMESRVIYKSTGDTSADAIFGEGVYVTGLSPFENSKTKIFENNYFPEHATKEKLKLVEYAIQLDIPSHELKLHPKGDGYDIYVYPERDLWIDNYPHKCIKVPEESEDSCTIS